MNCLETRELLPELAVGVLSAEDREEVERHIRWCAGCRKEASELGQAAAAFAFALPPARVPSGLQERVVVRIKRAAGAPGYPRRTRAAAASVVAAMVAVAGLGWGAVMAGRAERFADRAAEAQRSKEEALSRFRVILSSVVPGRPVPEDETRFGQLASPSVAGGDGAALEVLSPTRPDFVIVLVSGLEPARTALPLRVTLASTSGQTARAGRITELDADGGAEHFHQFDRDLTDFVSVVVRDADGGVVLSGAVET